MNDWRIDESEEFDQHRKGKKFFKAVFPDFWKKAWETKNNFYHYVYYDAKKYVEEVSDEYKELLEDERVQGFWHAHCNFCMDKIMTDMDKEFYFSPERDVWICPVCFDDFKARFEWVELGIAEDVPVDWIIEN